MAEQLPFDDGALDAVVTTSAFHFFDQPAALREFHRVLASGLVALATLSARQPLLQRPRPIGGNLSTTRRRPRCGLCSKSAGFAVRDQHRVRRPPWTRIVSDLITVGTKS
jgi:ubiquinone/menaquinone biosynthesis C-methylase UbiE